MLHMRLILVSGQIQLRAPFSRPEGVLLRELPLYYNLGFLLHFNKFRLTTHSRTCATNQLKWLQNTKYYPVKALVARTSCKRTHPHPVNDRDHFLRWHSWGIFHDAMVWSPRSLYVLRYSEYQRSELTLETKSIYYIRKW